MKKFFAAVTALALALAIGGTALAQGMGGCGNCGKNPGEAGAPTDQFKKFQQETLDLRQEMMNKRFELQRENLKGTPDQAKVAALKADVSAIQTKIQDIRVQNGLPEKGKRDGECFKMDGGCNKPGGMGGCNQPNGMGGCNGQPCGQK